MRNKWVISAVVLILGLAAMLHLYAIREGCGALLLWNKDKAYLIMHVGGLGYRMSYLRFVPEPILERLYYVPPPDAKIDYAVIFEITAETVHRFDFQNENLECVGAMGPFIYCGSEKRGFVKWTGSKFEPASPEKPYELMRANLPYSYDNINGWSKRGYLPYGETLIDLGGKQVTLVRTGVEDKEIAVEILRPGQPPQRIWYLNERVHWISKAEFDAVFTKR